MRHGPTAGAAGQPSSAGVGSRGAGAPPTGTARTRRARPAARRDGGWSPRTRAAFSAVLPAADFAVHRDRGPVLGAIVRGERGSGPRDAAAQLTLDEGADDLQAQSPVAVQVAPRQ